MATPPDFTAGSVLTAAQMNSVGLWLIGSTTIGTTVSAVTLSGLTGYDSYRIVISGTTATGTENINIQVRTGTTTSTTGYYGALMYVDWAAGTSGVAGVNNQSSWQYGAGCSAAAGLATVIDLVGLGIAKPTQIFSTHSRNLSGTFVGYHSASTAYDQLVLTVTGVGQTITGGTAKIYGYRN